MNLNMHIPWSPKGFMMGKRKEFPNLVTDHIYIKKHGITSLSLERIPDIPVRILKTQIHASGTIESFPGVTVHITVDGRDTPIFSVANVTEQDAEKGERTFNNDIVLYVNDGTRSKTRALLKGIPFVVGKRAQCFRNFLKFVDKRFPPYAFAATNLGNNYVSIESLTKKIISVFLYSCNIPSFTEPEIDSRSMQNVLMLNELMASGEWKDIATYPKRFRQELHIPGYDDLPDVIIPFNISLKGELLGFGGNNSRSADEYYEFFIEQREDKSISHIEVGQFPNKGFLMPLPINKIIDRTIESYNSFHSWG